MNEILRNGKPMTAAAITVWISIVTLAVLLIGATVTMTNRYDDTNSHVTQMQSQMQEMRADERAANYGSRLQSVEEQERQQVADLQGMRGQYRDIQNTMESMSKDLATITAQMKYMVVDGDNSSRLTLQRR